MTAASKRILILIGGHLCTAPRPFKEAEALAAAGYDVEVAGVWFDDEFALRDRALLQGRRWKHTVAWDFRGRGVRNLLTRAERRLSADVFRYFGRAMPAMYGYGARALLKHALAARADLTIVHSESGLWLGQTLLRNGMNLGVDFEDWFSEDLPQASRRLRPVRQIAAFERELASRCRYVLATSRAMSTAMASEWQSPPPATVRNVFPASDLERIDGESIDRPSRTAPSLHWFSQTIGPGRGLESLFDALPQVTHPCEVHLRGACSAGARNWLDTLVPQAWRERLFVHSTVQNSKLLSRISEHDIGLALETNSIRSRDLTITNKIFQYMQGGLAVVATATSGQREVFAEAPDVGVLVPCDDARALASGINGLLASRDRMRAAQDNAVRAAQQRFCWEKESGIVVDRAQEALAGA